MTAPNFFLPPRPGELLYSALARNAVALGGLGPKAAMRRFFGRPNCVATVDLPNNLAALAARLPDAAGLEVEALAMRHTLLPYYVAFQPSEVRKQAIAAMTGMAGSVHMTLGLAASKVRRPKSLQFCPECVAEMIYEWGTPHWRRDQQLPGVLVCYEHGVRLRASSITIASMNRHEFVPCTLNNSGAFRPPVTGRLCGGLADTALEVARRSAALLETLPAILTFDERRDDYRARLARAGLMKGRYKANQKALCDRFLESCGAFLDRVSGLSLDASTESWLSSLVRSASGAQPPLQHVLLGLFLDAQPDVPARPLRAYKPRVTERSTAPASRTRAGASRLDWHAIDFAFCVDLRREAMAIRSLEPPVRVTLSAIESRLGRRNWLQKRRAKLPRSTELAAEICEDVRSFRLRRLEWHVDICVLRGELDPWVVLRQAGLRTTHIRQVRERLNARSSGAEYLAYRAA